MKLTFRMHCQVLEVGPWTIAVTDVMRVSRLGRYGPHEEWFMRDDGVLVIKRTWQ